MPARALLRAAVLGTFGVVLLGPGAAFADAPSTWQNSPHVSGLSYLIVLFLIPLGLGLVISLLVVLPSLVKGDSYQPGQQWLGDPEWFGGPRGGVQADEQASPKTLEPADKQGGAGARF